MGDSAVEKQRCELDHAAPGVLPPVERQRRPDRDQRVAEAHERLLGRLAHETFAMRMLTRKRLELAHEAVAVARLQLRIDVLFDRVEPQLFEAFDLGARERLLLETPERCTAPQGERVRDATFGDQPLESLQVQLIRLEVQLVPVRPRVQLEAVAQRSAEARDVHLEDVRRRLGWIGRPQSVDQRPDRDRRLSRARTLRAGSRVRSGQAGRGSAGDRGNP